MPHHINQWKKVAIKASESINNPWENFDFELKCERAYRWKYDSKSHKWSKSVIYVKMEKQSFDSGAQRWCYRLKKLPTIYNKKGILVHEPDENDIQQKGVSQWLTASNYIAKAYKIPQTREVYERDVQLQMDLKLWAQQYNKFNPPKPIDIIQMTMLEFLDRSDNQEKFYHLERYIEGEYVKYNSNTGFVLDKDIRMTPQAFSHFTFERSGHALIVVDIQGVGDLWTDPQIHTCHGTEYNDGNLGIRGMALFFHSHACNSLCRFLNLSPFDLAPLEKGTQLNALYHLDEEYSIDCHETENPQQSDNHNNNDLLNGNGYRRTTIIPLNSISSTEANSVLECENTCDDEILYHSSMLRHRPSCIDAQSDAFLSQYLNGNTKSESDTQDLIEQKMSILGLIHLELCRCYENGRLNVTTNCLAQNTNDNGQNPNNTTNNNCNNNESIKTANISNLQCAFFHLKLAAQCGLGLACDQLARIYLGLPRQLLPDYDNLHDEDLSDAYKRETGLKYMERAANLDYSTSMHYLAQTYQKGFHNTPKDIKKAIHWSTKLLESLNKQNHHQDLQNDDAKNDINVDYELAVIEPLVYSEQNFSIHKLYANLGELHKQQYDMCGESKHLNKAVQYYNMASETALQALEGKLAIKYLTLAEECNTNNI